MFADVCAAGTRSKKEEDVFADVFAAGTRSTKEGVFAGDCTSGAVPDDIGIAA